MPKFNPDVAPPFDQGVFLMHYNRGKEAFQEGRYAEARGELEIAQRFRPDDSDVLNLLGLVYFKTNAFPEAEVIYRRLIGENSGVFILHSNLGLILFKQGKLDEAEKYLLSAVTLRPNYSKSHLYLGLLYKQKKKYGLALEHLQFAGAEKAIREVEAEMKSPSRTAPVPSQAEPITQKIARPAEPITQKIVRPPEPMIPKVARHEMTPAGIRAAAEQARTQPGQLANPAPPVATRTQPVTALTPPPPRVAPPAAPSQPVAPIQPPSPRVTAPALPLPALESTATHAASRKLQQAVDETAEAEQPRLDLGRKIEGASKTFTLHENGFLEINFAHSVHVKRGTVSSYSGNLKFLGESQLEGTTAATLVKAAGHGKLFVFEKGRKTFLLDLNDEFIYVEGANLLALEDSLSYRVEPIYDASYQRKIDTVKIFGKGSLAISTSIEPLTLRVTREYPLSISSNALVAWTGNVIPTVMDDSHLADVMIEAEVQSFKIRFEGDGVVVSEQ